MSDSEVSARSPQEWMPAGNGGMLRRGGGRPPLPKVHTDAVAMFRAGLFPDEKADRIGVIQAVLNRAMKGDMRAAEIVLSYAIGKPTERIDLTVGIREAVSRVAAELGIDDTLVQAQVDAVLLAKAR